MPSSGAVGKELLRKAFAELKDTTKTTGIVKCPEITLKPSTTNVHKITGISLEVITSASDSSDVSSEGSPSGRPTGAVKSRASKPKVNKLLKVNSTKMKTTKSTQRKHLTTSGTHEGAGLEWRVRQPGTGDTVRHWWPKGCGKPRRLDAAIARNLQDYMMACIRAAQGQTWAKVLFPRPVTFRLQQGFDSSLLDDSDETLARLMAGDMGVFSEAEGRTAERRALEQVEVEEVVEESSPVSAEEQVLRLSDLPPRPTSSSISLLVEQLMLMSGSDGGEEVDSLPAAGLGLL